MHLLEMCSGFEDKVVFSAVHNQLFNNLHLYRQWEKQLDGVPVSDGSLVRHL